MSTEIEKLRLSLVRIAQAAGLKPEDFPPVLELTSFDFDHLIAATHRERGWNALAATIVGKIEDRERDWRQLAEQVVGLFNEAITGSKS